MAYLDSFLSSSSSNTQERPQFLNNLEYGKYYVFHSSELTPVINEILGNSRVLDRIAGVSVVARECDDIHGEEVYIAMRRFNVGNVDEDAVMWARVYANSWLLKNALGVLSLYGLNIDDDTLGDEFLPSDKFTRSHSGGLRDLDIIDEDSYRSVVGSLNSVSIAFKDENAMRQRLEMPEVSASPEINLDEQSELSKFYCEECRGRNEAEEEKLPELRQEEENEEEQLIALEERRTRDLNELQADIINFVTTYHEDPSNLLKQLLEDKFKGKYVLKPDKEDMSRIVVNRDLQIMLTDWSESPLPLHALSRTIYILFLRHPEGIVLKNIADYRQEMLEIYNIVKPGRDEVLAVRAVDSIIDYESNALSQNLSRIKRAVKTAILDDKTASQYYITGTRGKPYRISLPRNLVSLPAIFTV